MRESPSSPRGQSESPSLPEINEDLWGQKEFFSVSWSERALALGLTPAPGCSPVKKCLNTLKQKQ